MENKKRVLLGMSGGVDSTVSAILLKKQGYEVIGATMVLTCKQNMAVEEAKNICNKLSIEHHVIDCQEEFKNRVVNNFVNCYKCAKTPNPCIECNKYLKFGLFYKKALELECDYISTGHYAKIEYSNKYNQYVLKKSASEKKDQTYFLYNIDKEVLPKLIFPLETFENKEDVRKIARQNNLEVAQKKDSQEVCFIENDDYIAFLEENISKSDLCRKNGNIVLQDGTILGKHSGLIKYTVGQRKGLGVSYKEPLYVLKLDQTQNEVIVGKEEQLYSKTLQAEELNFLISNINYNEPIEIMAKVRYRAKEAKAKLKVENKKAKVFFEEPQRAITPGQSVVFYIDDGIVLGGGKII